MIYTRFAVAVLLQAAATLFFHSDALGQARLSKKFSAIAKKISGKVGVSAVVVETGETASLNDSNRFPMQSVYKFPIAMAILDRVDRGLISIDSVVSITPPEYIPENGHSPIRDKFPGGVRLTVKEIIRYNVEESDGTACDVLLRLLGGTSAADKYVHSLGVTDIEIATTEMIQVAFDTIQYRNWSTPAAMTQLFKIFCEGHHLSKESQALLSGFLSYSAPWFDRRIKALLPKGTPVMHKTGTAGTYNGLTRATNDAGVITLPNGSNLAIAVFITDSYATQPEREVVISKIARAAYDYWSAPTR